MPALYAPELLLRPKASRICARVIPSGASESISSMPSARASPVASPKHVSCRGLRVVPHRQGRFQVFPLYRWPRNPSGRRCMRASGPAPPSGSSTAPKEARSALRETRITLDP